MLDMFDNLNKREQIFMEMLEITIGAMIENELCSYCSYSGSEYCYSQRCCDNAMFDGILTKAKRNLQRQCDELGNRKVS